MKEYLNIPYTQPPRNGHYNQFDLYVPSDTRPASSNPLVCFIHGGGWTSEDKSGFKEYAHQLASSKSVPCTVAIVNYRLTTSENKFAHPAHAADVLQFLEFAKDWDGPDGTPLYDRSHIYALGHSCGAHMLTSIFLKPPANSPADLRVLIPSHRLLQSVRGVTLSGGGFDIDRILASHPQYREIIIVPGFGDLPAYEAVNTTKYDLHEGGENIKWLLIYSSGDSIVNADQTEAMAQRLKDILKAAGKSEDSVRVNWDLTSSHNGLLSDEVYFHLVQDFVAAGERSI